MDKKLQIFLFALIILSVLLRIFLCLVTPPAGDDELYLYDNAKEFSLSGKFQFFTFDYEPALVDSTITGIFYRLVGNNSFFVGKLLELCFGILNIILVFFVGWKCYDNKNIGLLAAAFLSLSLPHIIYSITYYKYMKASFFVLLSVYVFWEANQRNKKIFSFLAGIIMILAFLTKFFIIVSLVPILLLIFRRKYRKHSLMFLFGSLSLFLLFMFISDSSAGANFFSVNISKIIGFLSLFPGDATGRVDPPLLYSLHEFYLFNPLIFILFFLGSFFKSKPLFDKLCRYTVYTFMLYIIFSPYRYIRLLIPVLPLLCICAAKFLYDASEKISFRKVKQALVLLCVLVYVINFKFLPEVFSSYFMDSFAALYAESALSENRKDALLFQTKTGVTYYRDFGRVEYHHQRYPVPDPELEFLLASKEKINPLSRNRIYDNGLYVIDSKSRKTLLLEKPGRNVYLVPFCGDLFFGISELFFSKDGNIVVSNRSVWPKSYNLRIDTIKDKRYVSINLNGNFSSTLESALDKTDDYIRVELFDKDRHYEIYRNRDNLQEEGYIE
ncbi:MAG: glycosyltransferase family 39 protein [Candidatus Omnitrophica bacterium]|nr:glycosyltransferase family 39 protein [Candidatus Omnitrophota bacterium]